MFGRRGVARIPVRWGPNFHEAQGQPLQKIGKVAGYDPPFLKEAHLNKNIFLEKKSGPPGANIFRGPEVTPFKIKKSPG